MDGAAADPGQRAHALAELIAGCVDRGIGWLSVEAAGAVELADGVRHGQSDVSITILRPGSTPAPQESRVRTREPRLRVTLCESGGRNELVAAASKLAAAVAAGKLLTAEIDSEMLRLQLPTYTLPPVDLLIRTGGGGTLSGFLLWQAAYAELLFIDTPFAELRRSHLDAALNDYARRKRTFGALPAR
jgi:hypothetical protein